MFSVLFTVQPLPSVLWRCWLGGRKGIRLVETEWWGAGVVICLERGADLHMAQLMPLPLTVSCFSKIQIGLAFLVLSHVSSSRKRAVKRVWGVCVRVSLTRNTLLLSRQTATVGHFVCLWDQVSNCSLSTKSSVWDLINMQNVKYR